MAQLLENECGVVRNVVRTKYVVIDLRNTSSLSGGLRRTELVFVGLLKGQCHKIFAPFFGLK